MCRMVPPLSGKRSGRNVCETGRTADCGPSEVWRLPARKKFAVAAIGTHQRASVDSLELSIYNKGRLQEDLMHRFLSAALLGGWLLSGALVHAQDAAIERLLRVKVFNQLFEGFDFYTVEIQEDRPQDDGSREVLAVANGKFLEHAKRLKVLFLLAGEDIIGGQILEGTDLPPCKPSASSPSSSL